MLSENFNRSKVFAGIALILIGVLGRLFLKTYVGIPNFEMVTAITLVSAVFLGGAWALVVPLSVMAISDVIIGNSSILFFTWSAFAVIGVGGWAFGRMGIRSQKTKILGITGMGIASAVFFFLYTNGGWWLMTNMYPHTLSGLAQAYIMGLPFFKNNLVGNLIFVPAFSMAAVYLKSFELKAKTAGKVAVERG